MADNAGGRRRRLVFLGTPADAVPPLRALVGAGHDVALVVTQPDRRRGRGSSLLPSPVKVAAEQLGIPVTHRVDDVIDVGAELGVVVAYGRLVKPHVLERVPMLNLHFSLLPRWRGAAPVERAILAGDTETGVCVMELEAGLDTGPVHACRTVPIGPDDSAGELRSRLVDLGSRLLVEVLAGELGRPVPQKGEPTYAAKVDSDDFRIDWSLPAEEIHRVVRAGDGRAFTTFRGRRLKIHRTAVLFDGHGDPRSPGELDGTAVATGSGWVGLVDVQPEGRGRQPAEAWLRGARPRPGERLGG